MALQIGTKNQLWSIKIFPAVPLVRQLEHFSDVIRGKVTPIVDAKSARETLAVILQIEQATMPAA